MLSKEEYKREYIRMMDSVRDKDSMYKNQACCDGVDCKKCPLMESVCGTDTTTSSLVFEIIDIVEKWSKEHPIQTNLDKFKEVFGIRANIDATDLPCQADMDFVGDEFCHSRKKSDEYYDSGYYDVNIYNGAFRDALEWCSDLIDKHISGKK